MRGFVWAMGVASLALMAAATAASAQETEPTQAPEPTIQPLSIQFSTDGLSGDGADIIRADLENAQFVAIGEDHGFADAPRLVAALAAETAEFGDYHYAIEVGPWTAEWIRDHLSAGGADNMARELEGRPLAIPFLSLREEAEVAEGFLGEGELWGIDQEFIGSPLIHLEWLASRAGSEGDLVRELFEAEKTAFAAGNQPGVFMATATAERYAELRAIFSDDAEALELIDAIEASQAIYRLNFAGRGFDNNLDRVELIREYFLEHYSTAAAASDAPPRVIMKMGAVHIGRATSPMKTFDIGSLIEGIAAANGLEALRIAYLPIGGQQIGVRPSPDGAFSIRDVSRDEEMMAALAEAGVDMSVVEENDGHFVIPLEPVRRAMGNRGLNDADWTLRFVVLGFDYLVTTSAGKPGTPLAER